METVVGLVEPEAPMVDWLSAWVWKLKQVAKKEQVQPLRLNTALVIQPYRPAVNRPESKIPSVVRNRPIRTIE